MKRLLIIALTLTIASAASAAEVGYAQDVAWRGGDRILAEGMTLFRMTDDRQTTRMLLVSPTARRYVLTNQLAASGIATVTLRDDGSGWSATITHDYGVSRGTLQGLFAAVSAGNPATIGIAFAAEKGGRFAATDIPYAVKPADADQQFAGRLLASPAAETLRASIPAELKQDLGFMDAALIDKGNGLSFRKVVDVLRALTDGQTDAPPQLDIIVGGKQKGVMLTSPDQVAFAATFRSVVATEPTADR